MMRFSFRRTPFDWFLLLFLVTVVVGLWAAYDKTGAWRKFGILLGAVLIYYLLTGLPQKHFWLIPGGAVLVGALIAIYFLLTHDWQNWAADISFLNRIGTGWQSIRPWLPLPIIHPNVVGGILAVLAPLMLLFAWQSWGDWVIFALTMAAGLMIALAFLLTSSRAAWLSLAAAASIWFLWWLCQQIGRRVSWSGNILFVIVIVVCGGLMLLLPGGIFGWLAYLPGPDSATSRLELTRQTADLITDFPLTGCGLVSFPGLYSQYIRVIPHLYYDYSHNLYLDLFLEQGVLGLMALLFILVGALILLLKGMGEGWSTHGLALLSTAVFIGLVTLLIHGLMDDALYGMSGTPLLFVFPAITVLLTPEQKSVAIDRRVYVGGAIVLVGLLFVFRQKILSTWVANLGAVQMAHIELSDWPMGEWDDGRYVTALTPMIERFEAVLEGEADNRTAHHRLGLIAMSAQDFETAVDHLEAAHQRDPGHRGIQKSLGYSYVWHSDLEKAQTLLIKIPEAKQEMDAYSWWWRQQGREDLAVQAVQMESLLSE